MHDFMRKYKRHILVVIILLISVPFVLVYSMPDSGPRGQGVVEDPTVIEVGGVQVTQSQFIRALDATAQQQARGGQEKPTYKELAQSPEYADAYNDMMTQLINGAFIELAEENREFLVDKDVLVERMQGWALFQKEVPQEEGVTGAPEKTFDPEAWNEWVRSNQDRADWNEIFESERKGLARQVYLDMLTAPSGRVFDADIEKELTQRYSKYKVRHTKVEPKVELTEEQITTHYNDNLEQYRKPDDLVADYIAISLKPEKPAEVEEVLTKARAGEDFAELAKTYSASNKEKGGDMGWQKTPETIPDHRKPLFDLAVGEISDPVTLGNSYFIYKVEEERTNEESGLREVKARQITISAKLADEEREARQAQADELAAKVKESQDLAALAKEAGLEVKRTGLFTKESREIEGLEKLDAFSFARAIDAQEGEKLFDVIPASQHLYIAKVVERTQGVIPPLADVRERVETDALRVYKRTDEYIDKCLKIAEEIKEKAKTLNHAKELFGDSLSEIKESKEFTGKQEDAYTLYAEGLSFATQQIIRALDGKEPGDMAGPIADYSKNQYFVELVSRTDPTEEEKAAWSEEAEELRARKQQMAENLLLSDYLKDLNERMIKTVPITQNTALIDAILGIDDAEDAPAEEANDAPAEEAADAPAEADRADAASETPAAENADATETPAKEEAATPATSETPAAE